MTHRRTRPVPIPIPTGNKTRPRRPRLARIVVASVIALAATATATTTATTTTAGAATPPAPSAPIPLTLPAPTGPHTIGTTSLHLIDAARPDPWAPTPRARELSAQIWYPAEDTAGHPAAPYQQPGELAVLERDFLGTTPGSLNWPTTVGHRDAPADDHGPRRPVVLYSHGSSGSRTNDTALVTELASRGYVVVTIDHTFDATAVEFPGGRVEVRNTAAVHAMTDAQVVAVRVADTRFVLDRLAEIHAGGNPDVEHRALPPGLRTLLDPSRVGMFGHSMGGATTAGTMHDDPRVIAGINLDGPIFGPVATDGLNKPLLLMSSAWNRPERDAMWNTLWPHLTGWRRQFALADSGHLTYSDFTTLLRQGQSAISWPPERLDQQLGTIDGTRAIRIQRAYVTAFFELQLRNRGTTLFNGPSTCYPEMRPTR
ncbi:alpha/beta hydrolase family protein [Embleya sp. AB8]|uniref:alpha/beta hydrolase family protein n=1 Tax=Embleya sp. AB8 TaxID=3156304 RepID=UPI003C7388FD